MDRSNFSSRYLRSPSFLHTAQARHFACDFSSHLLDKRALHQIARLQAVDGTAPITKGAGGHFTHHRGIFIGWNKLKQGGKSHDLWHVRNTVQKHREFEATEATDKDAKLTAQIDWIGVDGKPVLDEKRTYQYTLFALIFDTMILR